MTELVIGGADTRLAEVIAERPDATGRRVRIVLGRGDLDDGHDESYVHARVVELLDAVQAEVSASEIVVIGFPPVGPPRDEMRRRCQASARVTAQLRGIRFVPA